MLHYLKLMLQLLMAPARGWEDVAESAENSRHTLLCGLLPLAALAALSAFTGRFYQLHPSFTPLLVKAVVMFIKYTVTYFIGVALLLNVLPRLTSDGLVNRERVELFCAYCEGMMAVIGILECVMPMDITLLQFLPIYVVVVICMGRRFVDVDERNIFRFAGVSVFGLIVPVYLIDMLLSRAV